MKKIYYKTFIIFLCLVISLISLTPAIAYRYKIESNNKNIHICADYYKFANLSKPSSADSTPSIPDMLLGYGISSVALREVTLNDLLKEGSAYLINYNSCILSGSPATIQNPILSISGSQIIFTVTNRSWAYFLEKSIRKRFQPADYAIFKFGNKCTFIINSNPVSFINAPLGYDSKLAELLINKGINVMPVISSSNYTNISYFDEYDKIINEFYISAAIICYSEFQPSKNDVEILQKIMNTGITLAIVESQSQTGFENLKYIYDTAGISMYNIQRAFAASNSRIQFLNKRVLFYSWLRGIIDRNIRLIIVEPLNDMHKTANANMVNTFINIENTFEAVSSLKNYINKHNYSIGTFTSLSNSFYTSSFTNSVIFAISIFIIFLSAYIFFMFTRKINIKWIPIAAFLMIPSLFFIPFREIPILAASIFFPFAAGASIFICSKNFNCQKTPVKIIILTALYLMINLTGAFIISANMSDIGYISGMDAFDGAIISYTIPLVLIFCFYYYSAAGIEYIKSLKDFIKNKPAINIILIFLLCAFSIYLYLARSGNNSIIPASNAELKLREFLEYILVARPRLKEFAIGYPCLFIYISTVLCKKNELIHPLLLIGLTIGGVSITNSFCHGFTSISISILRTLNGFALGSLVSICFALIIKFKAKVFQSND